jgi:hypothetical protein
MSTKLVLERTPLTPEAAKEGLEKAMQEKTANLSGSCEAFLTCSLTRLVPL